MDSPRTWAELEERLAAVFGVGGEAEATARDLLVDAVRSRYGSESLRDLPRVSRQIAFQKAAGVVLALEETVWWRGDDFLFWPSGVRSFLRATFARYFDGAAIAGPPWRLDPSEADLPLYAAWASSADF